MSVKCVNRYTHSKVVFEEDAKMTVTGFTIDQSKLAGILD